MGFGWKLALLLLSILMLWEIVGAKPQRRNNAHHKKHKHNHHHKSADYYISKDLPDGERITWVSLDGILAKERRTTHENVLRTILARTVSDGRSVVISILDGRATLVDCDIQNSPISVGEFTRRFHKDVRDVSEIVTPESLRADDVSGYIRQLGSFTEQHRRCMKFHGKLHQTTGGQKQTKIHRRRGKRSTDETFMFPGTKWCGRGNRAANYSDLGSNIDTDRCCRTHDHCPYSITSYQTKYGLGNTGFGTLSHCECDYEFRSCLKDANTENSHMVGNIFFNIYQIKCFTFEPKEVCDKYTWWGKCEESRIKIQGVLQSALEYVY